MRLKPTLYLTVAAIGIACVLAAAPAQLRAQTAVERSQFKLIRRARVAR